jgi:hypothetical protein
MSNLSKIQPRQATAKTKFRHIKPDEIRNRNDAIGFGMAPDLHKIRAAGADFEGLGKAGVGAWADWVKDSVNCPIFNMQTVESVRLGWDGPLGDQAVNKIFGPEFDPFNVGKDAQGVDYVESTMAQLGELNTYMIACAIFMHVETEPMCWTAFGNAWEPPPGTTTVVPISPDVYTQLDLLNGALGGAAGIATGASAYLPAVLENGWWSNYAAWHMVRGYNLRWQIGQHTNIMDEVLRYSAYMPDNAQKGTGSSSEVDIINAVARSNYHYNQQGSPFQFLKTNRIRIGSAQNASALTTNKAIGVFRPSNDDTVVGATYGGIDFHSLLKGNSEFRKLGIPYLIKAGVPIGLKMHENDPNQIATMQAYLALSQYGNTFGNSVFPQAVADSQSIFGGSLDGTGVLPVAAELQLDGSGLVAQQLPTGRAVFKSGTFKTTLGVKGFEVTEDWYTVLAANPDLRAYIMEDCGVRVAQQGP